MGQRGRNAATRDAPTLPGLEEESAFGMGQRRKLAATKDAPTKLSKEVFVGDTGPTKCKIVYQRREC